MKLKKMFQMKNKILIKMIIIFNNKIIKIQKIEKYN